MNDSHIGHEKNESYDYIFKEIVLMDSYANCLRRSR
jgi:hypothetical protein